MPMRVAASVTMDGGVLDGVLMASTPYQIALSYAGTAHKARFSFVFMSPDPIYMMFFQFLFCGTIVTFHLASLPCFGNRECIILSAM